MGTTGFEVRTATAQDVAEIVDLHHEVFRSSVGEWARLLLSGAYPGVGPENFCVVEASDGGKLVASTCLIPQRWTYDGVEFTVAQLELVATAAHYRGRGLLSMQDVWFRQRVAESGYPVACVMGLPAVYKRLGFHFAIPAKGGLQIAPERLPEQADGPFVREVSLDDLDVLKRLHESTKTFLFLRDIRSLEVWRYQESQPPTAEHFYRTFVVDDGKVRGYARVLGRPKRGSVVVKELATTHVEHLEWMCGRIRSLALEWGTTDVLFHLHSSDPQLQIIRGWSAAGVPPFGWQVRVDDWQRLLALLSPALNRRLALSPYCNTSTVLHLSVDGRAEIELDISKGQVTVSKVRSVSRSNPAAELTAEAFTQLVLGYRSIAELEGWHPDVRIFRPARYLLTVLFPAGAAFVNEPY